MMPRFLSFAVFFVFTQLLNPILCGNIHPCVWVKSTDTSISGGTPIFGVTTPEECQNKCEADPSCLSVDWDSGNKCWGLKTTAGKQTTTGVTHYDCEPGTPVSTRADEGACCDKIEELKKNLVTEIQSEIKHQLYEYNRCITISEELNCPPGFVYLPNTTSCYKVVRDVKRNWSSASQNCQDLFDGAHLAVITSKQESDAVNSLIKSEIDNNPSMDCSHKDWDGGNVFWIAGQRLNITNCDTKFVWKISKTIQLPMTYANWLIPEPNCGSYKDEHCAHIWPKKQYQWNDRPCDLGTCAVCEYNYKAAHGCATYE